LVERDAYLLELARYVVLNPVRAGMVVGPQDWPWSSYAAMCAQAPVPEWLQTDWILGQFGAGRAEAVAAYVRFAHEGARLPSVGSIAGADLLGIRELHEANARPD
jgi:hypothetical protein